MSETLNPAPYPILHILSYPLQRILSDTLFANPFSIMSETRNHTPDPILYPLRPFLCYTPYPILYTLSYPMHPIPPFYASLYSLHKAAV